MKKTFIAASMLGIFAAGSVSAAPGTETVNVTFTGEVKDLTCTVQVGGPNNVVDLGMLDSVQGSTGTIVPVMFRFSGCDGTAKLSSIQLVSSLNTFFHKFSRSKKMGTIRKEVPIFYLTASGRGSSL